MPTFELFYDLNKSEFIMDSVKAKDITEAAGRFKKLYYELEHVPIVKIIKYLEAAILIKNQIIKEH